MKRVAALTGLFLLFNVFGACSADGDRADKIDPSDPSGGRPPIGTGGEGGGEAPDSVYAPVIEIVSPKTGDEPTASNVLTSGKVEVTCSAKQSPETTSLPVKPSSVEIVALGADGEVIDESGASPADDDDEYVAELDLPADLENGIITIRCSATDTGDDPTPGSATADYFFDNGPEITINEPEDESAHAAGAPVDVKFRAEALPVTDDDPEAAVADVTLEIEGKVIEVDEDNPGVFTAAVDFLDATLFPETPSGEINVQIRATNERGIERTLTYRFVLDGEGPVITIVDPRTQAIVDEQTTLEFTIDDPLSGVDENSVIVDIAGEEYQFDPTGDWSRGEGSKANTFYFTFDATTIKEATWQVNINIKADDIAGNSSDIGGAHILYLDYEPPLISLDPPNVRELKTAPTPDQCSSSFDPVGHKAANDGDSVGGSPRFRAMVWDLTNAGEEEHTLHYARTDQSTVRLYLQPDIATGVIEDTDGDGVCDEIVNRDDLTFQQLTALAPTGTARGGDGSDFTEDPVATLYGEELPDDATPPICAATGFPEDPNSLCGQNSEMTRVIKHNMVGSSAEPVIYVVGRDLNDVDCTGEQWELTSSMTDGVEGWMCLAVRAVDTVGNIGVSRPLRVCVDIPGIDGTPSCQADDMPSCRADGCTQPPRVPPIVLDID